MIPLGKVADFEMGQAPPGTECNKDGEGMLFVKAGEFGDLYPIEREWTTKPLKHGKHGDVFICVVGATAGKLNLGKDCAIGRSVAAIRPRPTLETKYLYYQLQPWVLRLRAASAGSAQGVISKKQLAEVPVSKQASLFRQYKGQDYTARLSPKGVITFKGKTYSSPTGAAKAVVGTNRAVSGWIFWYIKDADGNWVRLEDYRE